MIPRKYARELDVLEKRARNLKRLVLSLIFLFSFFLLGSVLHETSHVLWLKFIDCNYIFRPEIGVSGFRASVQPVCYMNSARQLIFYSVGYISTILLGGLLTLGSLVRENNNFITQVLASTGSGVLMSLMVSLSYEGDVSNFLEVAGLPMWFGSFITLFVIMGVCITSLAAYDRFEA